MIIIHLSDLHFEKSIEDYELHISKIVDTLFSLPSFNKIVIVISGDITQQANFLEYKAAKVFINKIRSKIVKNFSNIRNDDVTVICVPGNHDVNHTNGELCHSDLQTIYKNNEYENEISKETEKLDGFFGFSNFYDCFSSKALCDRKDIFENNIKYSFFLLNSAPFSLKQEEDKGFHYINDDSLSQLSDADGNYNIAIMHHSPYCYTDYLKNELIKCFSDKFSLLLLGHEHYDSEEIAGFSSSNFLVLHGGALYKKGWDISEFSIININEATIEKSNYKWNSNSSQYENHGNKTRHILSSKESKGMITVTDEYLTTLKKDERKLICDNFEDYFVFPRMEYIIYEKQDKLKELKKESIFLNELEENRYLYITGNHSLGKTTLLKHLFNVLQADKVPLLLTFDDFYKNRKSERIIKSAFEEAYGNNPSNYERYLQLPKDSKVLLIDDVNCIDHDGFNSFILGIKDQFGYIILTSTEKIQFDWKDKVDEEYDYRGKFSHYKLTPFFKDKRKELVEILVPIMKTIPTVNDEDLITSLCDVLDSQKRFVYMTPDFIIQYVDYFCKNIGDVSSYDTNTFSKVFEANITNALMPNATGNINVDKIFLLLSQIAYKANCEKEYPIKENTIFEVVDKYNSDYGNEIKTVDFINICKKSKILYDIQGGYRFTSKNYFSYFIAREVLQIYITNHDATDIYNIVNYCCFGINSDILLHIIYLSNNLDILNIILEMLIELTDSWREFDGKTVSLRYLNETSKVKKEFLEKNSENISEEQVSQERESDDIRDIQTIDLYDYDESLVDDVINKVVKATSLLNIVARAFPSFEHMIKADQKEQISNMLYTVPNKIFYFWGSELDNDCDGFIRYFLQKNDDEYQLNQAVSVSIANMQNMSLSLLLDLYHFVMREGCKVNTFPYIDRFEHERKFTYQAEYLIAIEQYRKDPDLLIKLAKKEIAKNGIPAELSKRILYHAINTMPKLNISQKNQMASKIGLKGASMKKIDIKRSTGMINN